GRSYGPVSNVTVAQAYVRSLGYSGGVAGALYGSISNANATGTVYGTGKQVFVGGVVGLVSKANASSPAASVDKCSFSGSVYGTNSEVAVGGVIGIMGNGAVTNCAASATVLG
ncbi:MAG: GLUG motif-containing protein, partial [Sodaliphilus sp.]|nr:GLUG motif-containing protein [Sodaliphilus sp.]